MKGIIAKCVAPPAPGSASRRNTGRPILRQSLAMIDSLSTSNAGRVAETVFLHRPAGAVTRPGDARALWRKEANLSHEL